MKRILWAGAAALAILAASARAENAAAGAETRSWLADGAIYETHPFYHGGTFKDVARAIPDIASLGITTIYLMPVFQQPEGFPADPAEHCRNIYRIVDPAAVDPVYGAPEDLKALVASAHEHKLRVLFDLVANNAPESGVVFKNRWVHSVKLADLEAVAEKSGKPLEKEERKGKTYVYAGKQGEDKYDVAGLVEGEDVRLMHFPRALWGFAPDYTNPALMDWWAGVAAGWVKDFDIDGVRLDAPANNWNPAVVKGDHSILALLRKVKEAMAKIKPDAVLFAETPFVGREANAPPVLDALCEASYSHALEADMLQRKLFERDSKTIVAAMLREKIEDGAGRARFLETHDTPRVANRFPAHIRPLAVLMASLPGIPMIQAGQEVGATARYGPEAKVDFEAGNRELRAFYAKLFAARRAHDALRHGDLADAWAAGDRFIALRRFHGGDVAVVVVNLGDQAAKGALKVGCPAGTKLKDALGDKMIDAASPDEVPIEIPARSAWILVKAE